MTTCQETTSHFILPDNENKQKITEICNVCDNTIEQLIKYRQNRPKKLVEISEIYKAYNELELARIVLSFAHREYREYETILLDSNVFNRTKQECDAEVKLLAIFKEKLLAILKEKKMKSLVAFSNYYAFKENLKQYKFLYEYKFKHKREKYRPLINKEQNQKEEKEQNEFYFAIKKILILANNDIQSLTMTMDMTENKDISFAITKLVNVIQTLFPWFIERVRYEIPHIQSPYAGFASQNQTIAETLCALKCYIDACSDQSVKRLGWYMHDTRIHFQKCSGYIIRYSYDTITNN